MVRKWLTLDGEVLEESEWEPTPLHTCFYCDMPLIYANTENWCPTGMLNQHDFITLVNPITR